MSLKPPELPLVSRVIIGILVSLLVILATFGNIAVIYLLCRGRRGIRNRSISSIHKPSLTRHSVTCTFLFNLSVADLLHILLCAPFTLVADFLLIHWPFGQVLCRLVSYLQGVVVFLCAFTHIVLSLDRLVAIQCPIWRRRNLSSNGARLIILGIWLCAMTIPIPSLIVCQVLTLENGLTYCQEVWPQNVINQSVNLTSNFSGLTEAVVNSTSNDSIVNIFSPLEVSYSLVLMLFQYVIPLVVITSTYSAIVYRVWGSPPPGEGNVQRDEKRCASKKKVSSNKPLTDLNLRQLFKVVFEP
ncbi:hypothetical protein AHF37_11591 [Paragonimus kellicotti]|nr:hypothetical protein AHF37_11591 [Paragonimus kellicotti]